MFFKTKMDHPLTIEGLRILDLIARKYDCVREDYDTLKEFLYQDEENNDLCWAKVKGEHRCSRRHQEGKLFCGNHLRSQPYGTVIPQQQIALWVDPDLGDQYLVDQECKVYTNNVEAPKYIGRVRNGQIIVN